MDFWDILWFIFITFLFFAYLMVMFSILTDLFRDRSTSGGMKAVWIICLIFLPFITALVYLISRGDSMSKRNVEAYSDAKAQQDAYIRTVASGASATDQIAQAKSLLDSGAITQAEYDALKAKALG